MKILRGVLQQIDAADIIDGVLTIPEGVTKIKKLNSFYAYAIKHIVFSSTVKTVCEDAFEGFTELESVEFNEGLKVIEGYAFSGCSKLKEVILPSTLTSLGESSFSNCAELASVSIPDSIWEIREFTFTNNPKLKNVKLPRKLQYIGNNAFANCSQLQQLNLPNSLKAIDSAAFEQNNLLTELEIPPLSEFVNIDMLGTNINKTYLKVSKQQLKDQVLCITSKKILEKRYSLSENGCCMLLENEDYYFIGHYDLTNFKSIVENSYPYSKVKHIPNLTNSVGRGFITIGKPNQLTNLIQSEKLPDNSLSLEVFQALMQDQQENKKLDFSFFKKLLKYMNANVIEMPSISSLARFAYNMGMFYQPITETRTTKSGNTVTENINYAHKAFEFIKTHHKTLFKLDYLDSMVSCKFKPSFTKFLLKTYNEMEDKMQDYSNTEKSRLISNFYNKFEEIQETNTSHKGKQRKKAPTVEKFLQYFIFKYDNVTEETQELAQFLGRFYQDNEVFDNAVKILKEQQVLKIAHNITEQPIKEENPFDNINKFKFQFIKDASDVLNYLIDISDETFTYEFLDKHSYTNFILGKLCNCCAHLDGVGYGIMHASMTSSNVQNLIIKNNKGKIVAKSTLYVNRMQRYGVCNNVEINANVLPEDYARIYDKFKQGIYKFVEAYNNENPTKTIKQINVGLGDNDLKAYILKYDYASDKLLKAANYKSFGLPGQDYSGNSSYAQYVVYKAEDKLNKESEMQERDQ